MVAVFTALYNKINTHCCWPTTQNADTGLTHHNLTVFLISPHTCNEKVELELSERMRSTVGDYSRQSSIQKDFCFCEHSPLTAGHVSLHSQL